jgi:hypothetical protein
MKADNGRNLTAEDLNAALYLNNYEKFIFYYINFIFVSSSLFSEQNYGHRW